MNLNSKKLEQRVHRQQLIRLAEHFRNHKVGIPEWIKNSDDSYTRHEEISNLNFSDLPILINITENEIMCLDFGGASCDNLLKFLPYYGHPDSGTYGATVDSDKVSAGHGNGGKFYGISQFKDCEVVSYFKGSVTILRINREGDFVDIENEKKDPFWIIQHLGLDAWEYFKKIDRTLYTSILSKSVNVFCWRGISPKDRIEYSTKSEQRKFKILFNAISNYPQARPALRTRNVIILYEGKTVWNPLKPEVVVEDKTFGSRIFQLPNKLGNYDFNKFHNSELKVTLSEKPLTGDKSSLNILEIDAFGRNIGFYSMPELLLDKSLSKSLYAHIDCPELKKEYNCVDDDRVRLIENGVSSLFLQWCRQKLREVLDELTNKEKKKERKERLDELREFINKIEEELSNLLEEDILNFEFHNAGIRNEVKIISDLHGFGKERKLKIQGDGFRSGGKEKKQDSAKPKRNQSQLKIKLSNHDEDPLNPGNTYDLLSREPVLVQRVGDIPYGIWWINTQKEYLNKINIKDPSSLPFYLFLIKEIVFLQKIHKKVIDISDPDKIDSLNLELIDDIFTKVVSRLGIELNANTNNSEKIRNFIQAQDRFTILDISNALQLDYTTISTYLNLNKKEIATTFKLSRESINNRIKKVYTRK